MEALRVQTVRMIGESLTGIELLDVYKGENCSRIRWILVIGNKRKCSPPESSRQHNNLPLFKSAGRCSKATKSLSSIENQSFDWCVKTRRPFPESCTDWFLFIPAWFEPWTVQDLGTPLGTQTGTLQY
jgi:hypothetical protein